MLTLVMTETTLGHGYRRLQLDPNWPYQLGYYHRLFAEGKGHWLAVKTRIYGCGVASSQSSESDVGNGLAWSMSRDVQSYNITDQSLFPLSFAPILTPAHNISLSPIPPLTTAYLPFVTTGQHYLLSCSGLKVRNGIGPHYLGSENRDAIVGDGC